MAENEPVIANTTNVTDLRDGKRVTVEVKVLKPDILEDMDINAELFRDNRARARALVGAGFAQDGFIRNLDFHLQLPRLKRRTEIISKEQLNDDLWSYTIKVRSGIIFG